MPFNPRALQKTVMALAFQEELEKIAVSKKLVASAKERALRQAAALMDSATHNRGIKAALPESARMGRAAGRRMRQAAVFGATPNEIFQRVKSPAALKYKSTFALENPTPSSARAAQNTILDYDFREAFPDAFKPVFRVKRKSSTLPRGRRLAWKGRLSDY